MKQEEQLETSPQEQVEENKIPICLDCGEVLLKKDEEVNKKYSELEKAREDKVLAEKRWKKAESFKSQRWILCLHLGLWGSLVYPYRLGTDRPRFKSGQPHL